MALRESFEIGTVRVRAGRKQALSLPITRLVTGAEVDLPVRVVHGREEGPTVWIDAAINVLGFMSGSRYLPDRRDLNRSFPGSARGSLAGRIAHLMMREVVDKCEVGIDLHTGSDRRTNLPQIRADLEDPRTRELAEAFAAPCMLHARLRDGSLRYAARERGAKVLLYEAGEAWRMDGWAVDAGVQGVRRVLASLGMTDPLEEEPPTPSAVSWRSGWVRARGTGMLHLEVGLGARVSKGDRLGGLFDSFGKRVRLVHADRDGMVVGRTEAPLVNSGDAVVHIAEIEEPADS